MEQVNKLETIFSEGSLNDQLSVVETSLLKGGLEDKKPSNPCVVGAQCHNGAGGCQNGTGGCSSGGGVGCNNGGSQCGTVF